MSNTMIVDMMLRPFNRKRLAKQLAIDTPNGIAEEQYVKIGGIDQWVTIRGEDRDNPVLLFMHGDPGATHTIFNAMMQPWEKYFTVVQWDQRGSGKTLRKSGKAAPGTLTLKLLAEDGLELTDYLRHHLHKDKLLLVASSVGSTFATAMAHDRPELFYAYVGTDQNSTPDAQDLAYKMTLDWLQKYGNRKGVEAVKAIGPDYGHWTKKQFDEMSQWTIKANPTIPNMIMDVLLPSMLSSPSHSFRDLRDLIAGMNDSMDQLYGELVAFDVRKLGLDFKLPFFIFQGDTDALTPAAKAKEYFDTVKAPHKEFALIKNSGHLAAFTRPEQFLDELVKRVLPFTVDAKARSKK